MVSGTKYWFLSDSTSRLAVLPLAANILLIKLKGSLWVCIYQWIPN
jgi:hypothetical protein